MQTRKEVILQWLFGAGLVLIGLIISVPSYLPDYPPKTLVGDIVSAGIVLVIGGFYVTMLLEALFKRGLRRKWLWVIFLIGFPVFSAYVYYGVTRSVIYSQRIQAP